MRGQVLLAVSSRQLSQGQLTVMIEPVEIPLEAYMRLAEVALQLEKDRGNQLRGALVRNRPSASRSGHGSVRVSDVLTFESRRFASMR